MVWVGQEAAVVQGGGAVFVALAMPRSTPNEGRSYLLIDISNSFTKLAFASRKKLGGRSGSRPID